MENMNKLAALQRKMAREAKVAVFIIEQAKNKAVLRSNVVGKTIVSSTGRCYR